MKWPRNRNPQMTLLPTAPRQEREAPSRHHYFKLAKKYVHAMEAFFHEYEFTETSDHAKWQISEYDDKTRMAHVITHTKRRRSQVNKAWRVAYLKAVRHEKQRDDPDKDE